MAGAGYKLFATGDVLSASDVNTYIMQQTVMVFASSADRTTALSSVLAEGMISYLKDTNVLEVYDGSAWVGATGDITGLTAGTGVSITSASGPVPTVGIDTAVVPQLGAANTFTVGPQTLNTGATGSIGLIVKAIASQTADLQQWQDSGGTVASRITSTGSFAAGTAVSATAITANLSYLGPTGIGITVQGAASQTADLQRWNNNSGTVLANVTSSGQIGVPNININSAGGGLYNVAAGSYITFPATGITFNPYGTTKVGLIVKGAASQSANLQEWQNSAGTVMSFVSPAGGLAVAGGSLLSASLGVLALNATTIGAVIRGAASQTADLQQWQNSAGTVLAQITSGGTLRVPIITDTAVTGSYINMTSTTVTVQTRSATNVGLRVDATASQTANLQEWRDSSGNILAKIDKDGFATAPRIVTTNSYAGLREINSGGFLQLYKQNAAGPNIGSGYGAIYLRDGTTAGTLKLVVRAGAAGAETTILDNIPQ